MLVQPLTVDQNVQLIQTVPVIRLASEKSVETHVQDPVERTHIAMWLITHLFALVLEITPEIPSPVVVQCPHVRIITDYFIYGNSSKNV